MRSEAISPFTSQNLLIKLGIVGVFISLRVFSFLPCSLQLLLQPFPLLRTSIQHSVIMKFFLLSLPLLLSTTVARMVGINFDARLNNKACREVSDWRSALQAASNAGFHQIRLFGTSDCGQLDKAIQAALPLGIKIQVGVWIGWSFDAEKGALIAALDKYKDLKWLHSVSVGSEDLHRNEISVSALAAKITDVKGMLKGKGVHTMVGHVDSSAAW